MSNQLSSFWGLHCVEISLLLHLKHFFDWEQNRKNISNGFEDRSIMFLIILEMPCYLAK